MQGIVGIAPIVTAPLPPPPPPPPPPAFPNGANGPNVADVGGLGFTHGEYRVFKNVVIPEVLRIAGTTRVNPWDTQLLEFDHFLPGLMVAAFPTGTWNNVHLNAHSNSPVGKALIQKVYDWRSKIGKCAVDVVISMANSMSYEDAPALAVFATDALLCDGRAVFPFLSINTSFAEDGQVIREGRYQGDLVLRLLKMHLGTTNTDYDGWTDPPVGALVLIVTALERALCLLQTGLYCTSKAIADDKAAKKSNGFSHDNWGVKTNSYLKSILSLSDLEWQEIFAGAEVAGDHDQEADSNGIDIDEDDERARI